MRDCQHDEESISRSFQNRCFEHVHGRKAFHKVRHERELVLRQGRVLGGFGVHEAIEKFFFLKKKPA